MYIMRLVFDSHNHELKTMSLYSRLQKSTFTMKTYLWKINAWCIYNNFADVYLWHLTYIHTMDLWQRKQTLSSGYALGLGPFTAINPWPCALTITYLSSFFLFISSAATESSDTVVFMDSSTTAMTSSKIIPGVKVSAAENYLHKL